MKQTAILLLSLMLGGVAMAQVDSREAYERQRQQMREQFERQKGTARQQYDDARNCRVANRNNNSPDGRNSNYGFRVVLH